MVKRRSVCEARRGGETMRSSIVGAVLASGAAIAGVGATADAGGAALPRCHTGGLSAAFGRVDSGAGQRYVRLRLRNRSGHACRTQGWVGMQLVRRHGRNVPTQVVRTQAPSHRVVLRAGERAVATLHWTVIPGAGEPQSGACEPTARRVRITPPDETTSLRIRWPDGVVCQSGRIDVTPLRHR
jgi:hypothetical protein